MAMSEGSSENRRTAVSVIVPTRNRAASLAQSLGHLARQAVPHDWEVELLVVDNGSADATLDVAATGSVAGVPARVLTEPLPGVSRARNAGARAATGSVLAFLDDDVRPPPEWLEALAWPILRGEAAATVSLFRASEGRDAAWMTKADRNSLIAESSIDPQHPFLVGGSMAIRRDLFESIGGFEVELGPGALGAGGEDILLTHQLHDRGEKVLCVTDVVVEHAFDTSKLNHAAMVKRAAQGARSEAWVAYHWWGNRDTLIRPKLLALGILAALAAMPFTPSRRGVTSWEGVIAAKRAWHAQMRVEQERPRKFSR
jgi:glucosyl-dolichyl phosphate glucuronosyltransferase